MSPLSRGLAEVERRLRYLQHRLNEFTLLHALSLALSVLVLLTAALILVGLRADPPLFRVATAASACVGGVVVAAGALYIRRRWVDLHGTAWTVDRRARLTDRLTTLAALPTRQPSSRLLPLLVQQTLALGARWQPQQIHPRRLPRSVFLLLASLLVLASTAFVSRHPPPPASVAAAKGVDKPDLGPEPAAAADKKRGVRPHRADAPEASSPSALTLDAAEEGAGDGAAGAPGAAADERRTLSIAALPDRLQSAIRQAFRAEPLDRPRQLAGRSQSDAEPDTPSQAGRDGEEQDARKISAAPSQQPTTGTGGARMDQQGSGKPGEQGGTLKNAANPEPRHDGSSPGAGSASSPSGLMGPEGGEPMAGTEGPKTFKLTITSFLRGIEQRGKSERQSGKRVATTRGPAEGRGAAALSDRQLADDLLRKAEIPPAYEDIVRRVYSAKATQ